MLFLKKFLELLNKDIEFRYAIEITSLILPELELNIYGISDDICVIDEATVRAGAKIVDGLLRKFKKLKN